MWIDLFKRIILAIILTMTSSKAFADWSFNVGYHNPAGSTLGLNFMHLWTNVAFECGIGWIDVNTSDSDETNEPSSEDESEGDEVDTTTVRIAGDIDLKYLFGSGAFRPYISGGFGAGLGGSIGEDNGASAGTGGGFVGGGLFLKGSSFYVYGSYNLSGSHSFVQGGLGFDI